MTNYASNGTSKTVVSKQMMNTIFTTALSTYPWVFLNQYPGIAKLLTSMSWKETTWGNNHGSPVTGPDVDASSTSHKFWYNDPLIVNLRQAFQGNGPAINNLAQGYAAHGVMQVMGWHNIIGEKTSHPKFPYFQWGPYTAIANANGLLVAGGTAIDSLYWGVDLQTGLTRGAVAGMIVLENKFQTFYTTKAAGLQGITTGNVYGSMYNAVASYLGSGKDKNNTTPYAYVTQIMNNVDSNNVNLVESKNTSTPITKPNTLASRGAIAGC